MKISDSKTFCPMPWINLVVNQAGDIRVCSYSKEIGNLNDGTISDIQRGKTLTEVKECIKNETWHSMCNYCEKAESIGGRSDRQQSLAWLKDNERDFINANPNGFYPVSISINQSNLCNLACTYCGPNNSSEWSKFHSIPVTVVRPETNKVLDFVVQHANTIDGIMLGGGEPLLQKHTHKFLELLANPNRQLKACVTTNLSVPLQNNPVMKTILAEGDNIYTSWLISFEATGDQFEYVRHGAKWDTFKQNIQILKDAGQVVMAHPAYGIYCAFNLLEYCDFCVDNNLEIFWCDIFDPPELDVRFLPTELRMMAIANIDAVVAKYNNHPLVPTATLLKYKEMASIGSHFTNETTDDKSRAKKILEFNTNIEKILHKEKTFADLWPNIHQILTRIAS